MPKSSPDNTTPFRIKNKWLVLTVIVIVFGVKVTANGNERSGTIPIENKSSLYDLGAQAVILVNQDANGFRYAVKAPWDTPKLIEVVKKKVMELWGYCRMLQYLLDEIEALAEKYPPNPLKGLSAIGHRKNVRQKIEFPLWVRSGGTIWFPITVASLCILIIVLIAIGRMNMEKRLNRLEALSIDCFASYRPLEPVLSGEAPQDSQRCQPTTAPARRETPCIISPPKKISRMMRAAEELQLRYKPTVPTNPWGLGLGTIKGNVRSENQDYALAFRIHGYDIISVADGLGGLSYAAYAAYLAVSSAAASVIQQYGTASNWFTPEPQRAARTAMLAAMDRLAVEGDKLNITDVRGGLRTTLIIVIAGKQTIGYAYIGDGGACIVRIPESVEHFLTPQKASKSVLNILAASLGPIIEGKPVFGSIERRSGDLIIVGTDGVFDRVDDTFPLDVRKGCEHFDGNLQRTAETVLSELAGFKDTAGYICDDNLTLGLMGDGTRPLKKTVIARGSARIEPATKNSAFNTTPCQNRSPET